MVDTLSTLTPEAKQYYELKTLYRARQSQVAYPWGLMTDIPKNGGNSVSWRRFNALALATTPLTEGIAPPATPISITEVTATVLEYGNYVYYSDAVNLMAIDKVMDQMTQVLGQNGGETIDKVVFNVIQNGTNLIYASGATKGAQSKSTPITIDMFRKAVANLDGNNTHRFHGPEEQDRVGLGSYVGLFHPQVIKDIMSDQELKNAFQYNDNTRLYEGAIGEIYGIEIYQSTLCPIYAGQASDGSNVYGSIIVGQEAFGVVDVGGNGKMEMIINSIGSAGTSDPLHQQGSVGWKAWQIPEILNNNFMVQLITGATLG